ncbi:hypothetical protein CsSME_00039797 [Camellia sinensis var. sinensis]
MVGPIARPSPRQGVCTCHVKIIIRELMICTELFLVLWKGMASNRLFTYRLGKGFGYYCKEPKPRARGQLEYQVSSRQFCSKGW